MSDVMSQTPADTPAPGAPIAPPPPELDLANIQGNILGGFNKDHQSFLFLCFTDAARGRAWLADLQDDVATASEVIDFNTLFKRIRARRGDQGTIRATWINVAFTHAGLESLGVPQADLDAFPPEYKEGMRARAQLLGDLDDSDPQAWIEPLRDESPHALLLVAADTREDLHRVVQRQIARASNHGIRLIYVQEGMARSDLPGHEHFGFKDGVSQPGIRGVTPSTGTDPDQGDPGQDLVFPGEFVLGHPTMKRPPEPPAPPPAVTAGSADFKNPGPVSRSGPSWTKDGSYLVWRRLRQDVPGFKAFVAATAAQQGKSTDLIGAKLVGRYASGAPLERTKDQPDGFDPAAADPSIGDPSILEDAHINFFEYGKDPDGGLVPRAAHIRKVYPRDEPTPKGGEVDTQTHRILRRGIAFGLPYRSAAHGDGPRTGNPGFPDDRGLLFLCYQASIARQFEVVQHFWVNGRDFPEAGDGHDPIISQSNATRTFTLPGGRPDHLELMQRWVITTGGEYFLQPSISALGRLAEGGL